MGCLVILLLGACTTLHHDAQTGSDNRTGGADVWRRVDIRMQLAGEYYQRGQPKIALDEIKQVLQLMPNFVDAHIMAALIYMELGDAPRAEGYFTQALRMAPKNPDLSNNYGWFLCQNGKPEQSIAYFEAALGSSLYRSPARAMTNAGVCSLMLNRQEVAEKYLNDAFRLDPSNPATAIGLARLYHQRGDDRNARFFINRVMGADATITAEVLWLAIKIERRLGDRTAETRLVAQLRRRFPDSTEFAAYQRGEVDE